MPRYQVARSIQIDASLRRVYDVVADFGTWTTWSPWLLVEPQAKVTVSADPASVGSQYAWQGELTGQGELEHKRLEPEKYIEDELRFIKPFKSTCKVTFELAPQANGTHLTWTMDGGIPWFLFWMIPMFKTFIGMDYQRGLTMLKEWIETGAIQSKSIVRGVQQIGPLRMAGVAGQCHVDEVGAAMEKASAQARAEFARHGLPTEGGMIAVYTRFRVKAGIFEYLVGFQLPDNVSVPASVALKTWSLPASKAFHVEHVGSYRHLGNGWSVANQMVRHQKLKQSRCGAFEIYRTTPPSTPEAELQTDIYLPLR